MSVNASTGIISGTPTVGDTYYVSVRVTDGRGGVASRIFNWIVEVPAPANGSSGANPPVIFNSSLTAAAGDVVSLQGARFSTTPRVYLESDPANSLAIVNRVGTGWLVVRIPATAQGALVLRIANATGISAPVRLNAAIPHHLDATTLTPGGAFRLFGRNLVVPGHTPSLTVNGLSATIDVARSDQHMLTVTAPAALAPAVNAAVIVDNGNDTGAAQLDRKTAIVAGSGDPLGLGIGWASAFTPVVARTIDAATDTRIGDKMRCDGVHEESGPLQQAIDIAARAGGGVVQLPAGQCRFGGGVILRLKVVVRGAGKDLTNIVYSGAYPLHGQGLDVVGMRDFTLTNSGQAPDAMVLKGNKRVFIQNVRVRLGASKQMYLDSNIDFVMRDSEILQAAAVSFQGLYTLWNSAGLVFENNTTTWAGGSPSFTRLHDSYMHANRFTRDAALQADASSGAVHSVVIDLGYRLAVMGNTLDVLNGPVTAKLRNDGEGILTEGGGAARTESLGTVTRATLTTMTDLSKTMSTDPFGDGYLPENFGVAIVSGRGAGQMRHVTSYNTDTRTLTVDRAWDIVPDSTSHYTASVTGLEKTLIKSNVISQTPRGIWLYGTAMREIDVIGNTISEGGGIYVRAYPDMSSNLFTPIYGLLIKGNRITNTTRNAMSQLTPVYVNNGGVTFGTAIIGLEIRGNEINANHPNVHFPTSVDVYARPTEWAT